MTPNPINRHKLRGDWNVLKGRVRRQWGKLTDDDVERINGDKEELVGRLQRAYGESEEEIRRQIREFESRGE